jgi:hypothetical protein
MGVPVIASYLSFSRPYGTFRLSNFNPGLRPGLSSAVPSGLSFEILVLTRTPKPSAPRNPEEIGRVPDLRPERTWAESDRAQPFC